MKIKKYEIILLGVSLVFLIFLIGYFIGRGSVDSVVTVEPQIKAAAVSENSTVSAVSDTEKDKSDNIPAKTVFPINLNTATEDELKELDGIGDVLAERIMTYRDEHGNFDNIDEIMNVEGIGEKIFEDIREDITV